MKIQCKGVWTDKFAPFDISLKIGRATVLPPQKNYHSGEPIHGKEITFPCNIHDIDISEGNFTITLQVKDDSLAGYEEDIIGLSFLLPPHLKGKYRFSNVTLMDKNSALTFD